jgi:hypothetical protein
LAQPASSGASGACDPRRGLLGDEDDPDVVFLLSAALGVFGCVLASFVYENFS